MKAYDPLPNFHDPRPAPIPRAHVSRWPIILGAGCWIVAALLVGVIIAGQVQ